MRAGLRQGVEVDRLRFAQAVLGGIQQYHDPGLQPPGAVFRHHHSHLAGGQFDDSARGVDTDGLDKGLHQFGLEIDVAGVVEQFDGGGGRDGLLVVAVAGHRVIGIHDGGDAGEGRYVVAGQALRVT